MKVSHAAVKSFDRRDVSCKNARTVQFSGGVETCPVTQKTALPLANCSTHELQLNWTHGHRWSRVRCEEHRAWPTTTSIDAACNNQRCSPVGAGQRGNAAPYCADIGKQELPTGRWYARALAANAVPWATVTRGRTSDVDKLVAQLHSAQTAACQAVKKCMWLRDYIYLLDVKAMYTVSQKRNNGIILFSSITPIFTSDNGGGKCDCPRCLSVCLSVCLLARSHTRTVVRECCKGDDASQWRNPKFDPPPRSNHISDSHKSWQRWLRRGPVHLCKSSSRSAQGFRFRACVTLRTKTCLLG